MENYCANQYILCSQFLVSCDAKEKIGPLEPRQAIKFNMALAKMMEWRKLPVALTELCLATTLRCGQSFRYVLRLARSPPNNVAVS